MVESDRSSSFSDIENDSILSGSVYSSAEVGKGDASSVASLSSLPVGDIRPYCIEPEWEVDLETSTSSEAEETLDNDGHIGKEHLGNIIWYINISVFGNTKSSLRSGMHCQQWIRKPMTISSLQWGYL